MSTKQLPIDVAQPDAPVTDLAPAARALVALNSSKTEQDLLAKVAKHVGLVEIKDGVGRDQVHSAAMELMRARTAIKKAADEARDDAKKFNAAVISEEKRLIALVEPEETRLKALRDAWDAEQERIKREAEEKERQRLLALGARIQEIRSFAKLAQDCRTSDAVRRLVDRLAGIDMTGFAEFEDEAVSVFTETRQQVENTLNTRMATEAEAARLKAEREELARQQAEAKRQAEELERQQAEAHIKLVAEADKLAAERAELERMRAEIEAAKATIPAEVAPEKQALADAVREIADVGIAIAGDILIKSPVACGAPVVFTKSDDFGVVTIDSACTRPPPADADLVDTVSMFDNGTAPAPDAGVPWTAAETAEAGLGFDMAMSMPVAATPSAAVLFDDTPPAASLIGAIATAYGVNKDTACHWLCVRADDFLEWTEPDHQNDVQAAFGGLVQTAQA